MKSQLAQGLMAALLTWFASACVNDHSNTHPCEEGPLVCPAGTVCRDDGNRCDPENCGDGRIDRDNGEVCDDGNFVDGDGCSKDCRVLENCGDGKLDPGELCDYVIDEDCSVDCRSTLTCGDGVKNSDEQCDEGVNGERLDTASCDDDCTLPQCGDGHLNIVFLNPATGLVESCDERGNTAGCDADCTPPECGDGLPNAFAGEECDDGENDILTDECLKGCKRATCGDGYQWEGVEECEVCAGESCSGEPVDTEECDRDCTLVVCGDGVQNEAAGELCDDGNNITIDSCPSGPGIALCVPAYCGDGFVYVGVEQCESDVDTADCNRKGAISESDPKRTVECRAPKCGDGYPNGAAGEVCDDGNGDLTDNCPDGPTGSCKIAACGDGFVKEGNDEDCDDGNGVLTDECPDGPEGTCKPAECGDGHIWTGFEQCDGGNDCNPPGAQATNGQSVACQISICGDFFANESKGEECDDGSQGSAACNPVGAGESLACKNSTCGDGFHNALAGEFCDEGNDSSTCNGPGPAGCQQPQCGDNQHNSEAGEACDGSDGVNPGEVCNPAGARDIQGGLVECSVSICGDNYVNEAAGEECDSSNEGCASNENCVPSGSDGECTCAQ